MEFAVARLRFRQSTSAAVALCVGPSPVVVRQLDSPSWLADFDHPLTEKGPKISSIDSVAHRLPKWLNECVDKRVFFDQARIIWRLTQAAVWTELVGRV